MPSKKNTISDKKNATREKIAVASRKMGRRKRNSTSTTKLAEFETTFDSPVTSLATKNGLKQSHRLEKSKTARVQHRPNLPTDLTEVEAMNSSAFQSFVTIEESTSNVSIHSSDSEIQAPVQNKTKPLPTKSRAPRKRKLRPEDERTLKILSEKFHHSENGAVCQIPNCESKPMKCTKTSNLKRHISQVHPMTYATLFPNEVSAKKRAELETFNAIQDAIEMVTVNGYPFSVLSSSGMKGFIKSRLETIRPEGYNLSINRCDIVKRVSEESKLIKERITLEVQGKTVSIMFDVCTIATLSMLGVQAVYMKDSEVVCRSLGTVQITERHTSVNLANIVFDILAEFNITLSKVLSITTDTAKNATATTDILNLVASSSGNSNAESIVEESFFDLASDEEDDGLEFGRDIENEIELQKVIDNVAAQTALINEMAENIASKHGDTIVLINQVNCGTHVFQLAINNSIEESNSKETIQIVHDMCVLMRNQIVMIEIRKLGSKVILPPLDNATRWNSKYTMCRDFLKMKEIVIQLAESNEFGYKFETNEPFWNKVQEIVDVLSPAYNLTIDMQRVGYGLSDMYIGWLRVKLNLNRILRSKPDFNLATKLIENMDRRAPSLFNSPLMLCSIYLDPRINFKLSDEQRATAAMDLLKIHERVTASRLNKDEANHANDTLDEIQAEYQNQHNEDQLCTSNVLKEMSVYETEAQCDIKASVMQFWEGNSQKYPLLRLLANLLHAVPSNQCRTEASFSSLSYVRNRYRMSMHPNNVSKVLMVRLNKDIYKELREERMQKILFTTPKQ